jgi:hypothetical protein
LDAIRNAQVVLKPPATHNTTKICVSPERTFFDMRHYMALETSSEDEVGKCKQDDAKRSRAHALAHLEIHRNLETIENASVVFKPLETYDDI